MKYHFFFRPRLITGMMPSLGWTKAAGAVGRYFQVGCVQGLGTDKRILLLHGPVGSAKSTIARLLKKGLEHYSRTDAGALYTFAWKNEHHGRKRGKMTFMCHARCMKEPLVVDSAGKPRQPDVVRRS